MSYRQQGYRPQSGNQQVNSNVNHVNPQDRYMSAELPYMPVYHDRPVKHKRRPFKLVVLLIVFTIIATAGFMGYRIYDEIDRVERANTFYPGVYIDDVQLYGHSPLEVYEYLTQRTKSELNNFILELVFEDQKWYISRETLGMSDAMIDSIVGTEVNNAFAVGRNKGMPILDRYNTIMDLRTNPYVAHISGIEKNMEQIDAIIEEIRQVVYIEPQNAQQVLDPTAKNALITKPEKEGRDVDEVWLKSKIEELVNKMEPGIIQVQTKSVPAGITVDVLNGKMVQIANVATKIAKSSTTERTKNVELGCEKFNGMTVKPGEVVSFNGTVGLRTKKNGFYEANEIVGGEYTPGVGGGICQVSTTLYQAVIQAGLEVVYRENHAIPVNYADKGADATVYDNRIDFKFKNNTEAPIYIVAKVVSSKSGKTCEFQIYGRPIPNNYQYSLRHEEEIIPIPDKSERIPDREQKYVRYTDQTYEVSGKVGYKVKTYLVTRTDTGSFVEEKHITTDTYSPIPNKIYIGVDRR